MSRLSVTWLDLDLISCPWTCAVAVAVFKQSIEVVAFTTSQHRGWSGFLTIVGFGLSDSGVRSTGLVNGVQSSAPEQHVPGAEESLTAAKLFG